MPVENLRETILGVVVWGSFGRGDARWGEIGDVRQLLLQGDDSFVSFVTCSDSKRKISEFHYPAHLWEINGSLPGGT